MTEQTRKAYQQQQTFDNNISHQFDRLDFQSMAQLATTNNTSRVRLLWYVLDDKLWVEVQNVENPQSYFTFSFFNTLSVWSLLLKDIKIEKEAILACARVYDVALCRQEMT